MILENILDLEIVCKVYLTKTEHMIFSTKHHKVSRTNNISCHKNNLKED
jgi:hypothetical protein